MELPAIFQLRDYPTEEIIQLLDSTVLGTNGAIYRHLDTRSRIPEVDNPLYLSTERNGKALGNITFCRREKDYYIRYFAFKEALRSGKNRTRKEKRGVLKESIESYFQSLENNGAVEAFYAYIEPGNDRSLMMSEDYSFVTERSIATQSFSRTQPKMFNGFVELDRNSQEVRDIIQRNFNNHQFFHVISNASQRCFAFRRNDQLTALLCVNIANWEIVRLPGRLGKLIVKMIPFIPVVRKLINPSNHKFAVFDNVCLMSTNSKDLENLMEATLNHLKLTSALWWVDNDDPVYSLVKQKMKWGPLNKLTGVNKVNLVTRRRLKGNSNPAYVLGLDFI